VLDAACGLGYGTAILNDGTLADSVVGIDTSGRAIEYATAHYGPGRPRVSFAVRDVRSVVDLPPASLDVIVSFETLEHIEDPDAFLAACRRALTPAGRIVCSVPNDWTNAEGVDPNPHHLHVFDRARLEEVCRRHFLIEGVHGQTAGGGMKLSDAGRRMWKAGRDEQVAEWWLLVGMTEPAGNVRPVRHRLAGPTDDATNILAFDRDYDNPWLVRAMVVIGLRAKSEMLLGELAAKTFDTTGPATPDAGAALCVQAYRHVGAGQRLPDNLRQNIHDYVSLKSNVPHTFRWQVSLSYVVALSHLQQGEIADAARAFEACASSDALRFAPHLATKTVGAAFLRGWIALQSGCTSVARHWWTIGIDHAERALRRPWSELMLNRDTPAIFGLREATVIVDLASQCATGLALSSHAADRPGLVASQLFESLRHQLERASNVSPVREPVLKSAGPHEIERVEEATSRQSTPEDMTAWRLIDELDRATLVSGETRQLKVWQVTDADGLARCVYLHPPAALKAVVPTGAAGKLTMAVGLHPDVWTNPEASGCIFSINADDIVVSAVALDPLTRPGDRRWVSMSVDVPASTTGQHIVTLDTQKLGTGYFAWGLFKDVTFRERNDGKDGVRSGIAP
jgi:SAM-dependent methyltransferase